MRRWVIQIIVEDDGISDSGKKIFISSKSLIEELRHFPQVEGVKVTKVKVINVETW